MDIRDKIDQIKGEIKTLETGYAAIFGGDIIDIRGTGITHDFIIHNTKSWIADRQLEIEDLKYKLEALRLSKDIIKVFPKFFGNPIGGYEYHNGQDASKDFERILKRAKKIRNNTI